MGTHPIFESDFDCLTERKNKNVRIGIFANVAAEARGAPEKVY